MKMIKLDNTFVGLILIGLGIWLHINSQPLTKESHDLSIFLVSGGIGLLGTGKNREL